MADDWIKTYPALDRMIRATLEESDTNPADIRVANGSTCTHHGGISLDATVRKVTCLKCGADLDAFDSLLKISRNPDGYRRGIEAARKATLKARKNLDALERLEKNAKGRAWRALSKMPAAEVIVAFAVECEAERLGKEDRDLLMKRFREAVAELAGNYQASE